MLRTAISPRKPTTIKPGKETAPGRAHEHGTARNRVSNESRRLAESAIQPITIVVAEDHKVVREGLKQLLRAELDFQVIGEAGDGLETVRLVERMKPDILVLDLVMPRMNGFEALRQVKRLSDKTRILILTANADEASCVLAMQNGADGYVVKESSATDLIAAIRAVLAGNRHFSHAITCKLLQDFWKQPCQSERDPVASLTERERTVLQMSAEGYTTPQIAAHLCLSHRTVETHRANLMRKLSLHSQTDVVRFAIRNKLMVA